MSNPPESRCDPGDGAETSHAQTAQPAAPHSLEAFAIDVLRRLGPLSVLAVLATALPGVGGFILLGYRETVATWLQSHPDYGVWIYIAAFALGSGLALLPTYAQAVLGGFVFRFPVGFPAALAGFTIGALLGYLIARLAGRDRAMNVISSHPRARAVYDALLGAGRLRTLLVVTLLRFPPNSPFALSNLVFAATGVPLWIFLLGTIIGMAPRTAAMIYVGSTLKSLDDTGMPKWLFWAGLAAALAVIGVFGAIINRVISRVTTTTEASAPPTAR